MYHHSHTNLISSQYERDLEKLVRRTKRNRHSFKALRKNLAVLLASIKS